MSTSIPTILGFAINLNCRQICSIITFSYITPSLSCDKNPRHFHPTPQTPSQQTRNIDPILDRRWASVVNGGPA